MSSNRLSASLSKSEGTRTSTEPSSSSKPLDSSTGASSTKVAVALGSAAGSCLSDFSFHDHQLSDELLTALLDRELTTPEQLGGSFAPPPQSPASGHAAAAIVQQYVYADLGDYAFVKLVTLADAPHMLVAESIALPDGLGLLSMYENVDQRQCPRVDGSCKQYWDIWLDISEVCELDGSYQMDFSVTCAPDSDCAQLDPNFTEFVVPFILDSENFCGALEVECPAYEPSLSACSEACPCLEPAQGDCDSDLECGAGLSCVHDIGDDYGLPASWDLCM